MALPGAVLESLVHHCLVDLLGGIPAVSIAQPAVGLQETLWVWHAVALNMYKYKQGPENNIPEI